jgi:hypothetical protein
MAGSTRDIARSILVALEVVAVRIASRPSHAMTAHAKLFTGTAMTAGTCGGVDASLHPVLAPPARRRDPARWVRTPCSAGTRADTGALVTIDARRLAVTRRAQAGLGAGFLRVS